MLEPRYQAVMVTRPGFVWILGGRDGSRILQENEILYYPGNYMRGVICIFIGSTYSEHLMPMTWIQFTYTSFKRTDEFFAFEFFTFAFPLLYLNTCIWGGCFWHTCFRKDGTKINLNKWQWSNRRMFPTTFWEQNVPNPMKNLPLPLAGHCGVDIRNKKNK